MRLDRNFNPSYTALSDMLSTWNAEAEKLSNDEITKEDYDNWRYTYPKEESKRFAALIDERREKGLCGKSNDKL